MEARFGRSFGDVRVHTDVQAAASAEAIGARSYTIGRDIVFSRREYVPETVQGRRLLAHELAHVCQQTSAGECGPFIFSNTGAAVVQCKADEETVITALSLDLIEEAIVKGWITEQEILIEKVRQLNRDDQQALVGRLLSHHQQLMLSASTGWLPGSGAQADLEKRIFRIERAVHAIALEFEPELAKSVTTSPVRELRKARRAERRRLEAERKEREFAEIERELNRLLAEREGPPPIHPPPHIERRNRQLLPVAQAIEFFYGFLPGIGSVIDAYYAISGETLLGEKLDTSARVLAGVCAAIPFASTLIRAGKTGARAILQIARRTGRDPRQVLQTVKRLDALSEEKAIIEKAIKVAEQSGQLTQKDKEALAKLVEAVNGRRPPISQATAAPPAPRSPAVTAQRAGQPVVPEEVVELTRGGQGAVRSSNRRAAARARAGRERETSSLDKSMAEESIFSKAELPKSGRTAPEPRVTVRDVLEETERAKQASALVDELLGARRSVPKGGMSRAKKPGGVSTRATAAHPPQTGDDIEQVFRELSEELGLPKSQTATKPLQKDAPTPAQATKEAEKAERARRKAERAVARLGESREILANPDVARAARQLMKEKISDSEILKKLWESAKEVESVAAFARTTTNSRWARYRARLAFSSQLRRFWAEVAANEEAKAIFKKAGFVFEGASGTAPTVPGLSGKAGRLSVEHVVRLADDPFKALDADNLRFLTQEENTFLEVLKAAERRHRATFGGTFD